MADKLLESSAISAFCGSIATMLSAGVQIEEAVHLLSDNREQSYFKDVCDKTYSELAAGSGLADAMETTGAFPAYAISMVRVGEASGRTDRVLRSLSRYYGSEGRMFAKLQSAVGYPAAMLCIMSAILAFTVIVILPVFRGVYADIAGTLTSGSFVSVSASIVVGWIAFAVVLVATIAVLVLAFRARSESGRQKVIKFFEKFRGTRSALYQLALSRFTSALSAYIASGVHDEQAIEQAAKTVEHAELAKKIEAARASMSDIDNPRSLAQAISENHIFEPVYSRMLLVGTRSGSTDDVLGSLSDVFFDDATAQIDAIVDIIEPLLAVFLTIAVSATLIAVMMPLVGIMRSIG
ncbi:type II secretion system F family protein [Paratractidigestivibacter sp.]|uniref:type II secretion system F family protein n=1 Tax=Paratractidigestivibacter sp. TaxID=2847316 RepID=UPI002AC9077D|nr:type II secretion system F family protein [Paratractidigestivibacter sp.]